MVSKQESDKKIRTMNKELKETKFGNMEQAEQEITKFVKDYIKNNGDLNYIIDVERINSDNHDVYCPVGSRDVIKATLLHIEQMKDQLKSVVIMNTAFMAKFLNKQDYSKSLSEYKYGSLEQRYEAGDQNIKHVASISIYIRNGDKFQTKNIIFEINKNNDLLNRRDAKDSEFGGYLYLNI